MNDMTVRGLAPPDLCRYLGLSPNLGLYEIFSYYFEGKVKNDSTMIKVLENAFLNDSPYYYCIKLGVTFCWFTLTDRIQIKGKLQFSEPPSIYTVGKFMKHLRYEIALSGANLTKVKYLIWDESDLVNFEKYIVTYDKFSDFFNRIEGCKGLTCINIMRLLSRVRNPKGIGINFNAETFVKCLIDSYSVLGIEERDGVLYSRNLFYKDYSICTSSIINYNGCSYGFIIDTEGVKGSNGSLSNGISELGGLIFCRYNNIIMNVRTFSCDKYLLDDTIRQALRDIREFTQDSKKPIKTLVYGASDKKMLSYSLNKKLFKQLNFYDCKPLIYSTYKLNSTSQSNVAEQLGVSFIKPKHNPLSDAKTLFNIIAKLLEDYPEKGAF